MDADDLPISTSPAKSPQKTGAVTAAPQRLAAWTVLMAAGCLTGLAGVSWWIAIDGEMSIGLVIILMCSASALAWMWRGREIRLLKEHLAKIQDDGQRAEADYFAVTQRLEREVDEHRHTLEQLRASERNYRNVFENTGTATVILDHTLTIKRMNAKFAELTGARGLSQ